MNKVKLVMGLVWAAPITLVCFLFYVLPFWAFGWYRFAGWYETAWVWSVTGKGPQFLKNYWMKWAGHTLGNVIVMRDVPETDKYSLLILTHELVHSRQCMILGLLQPISYGLSWACGSILKKAMGHTDGYYDTLFEIHARRAAGQVVDIVGVVEKLQASKNN